MAKRKGYSPIGVDLQPNSAKMVQLYVSPEGASLACWTEAKFDFSLVRVEDGVPSSLTETLKNAIRKTGFVGRRAVVTLPAHKVDVRQLTLPGSEGELERMLRWEAESYLHYDVSEASIDYVKLGEVKIGNEMRSEVMVASASRSYVNAVLGLLSGAGLVTTAADVAPMALGRLGAYLARDASGPVAVIDIGRTASVAVILNQGELRLTRTIAKGGEEFTERIMNSLEVSREEAELLKQEYGAGTPQRPSQPDAEQELVTKTEVAATIHEILRYDLEEMADELQKLFRYFSTQCKGAPISLGYLCGGGGRLKDLDVYMTQRTGTKMARIENLNAIFPGRKIDMGEAGPEYAVAAGLALREQAQ